MPKRFLFKISAIMAVLLVPAALLHAEESTTGTDEVLQKMQQVNAQYGELLDKMDDIEARRKRLRELMNASEQDDRPALALQPQHELG